MAGFKKETLDFDQRGQHPQSSDVPTNHVQIYSLTDGEVYYVDEDGNTSRLSNQTTSISGALLTINNVESDVQGGITITIDGYTSSTTGDGHLSFDEIVPLTVNLTSPEAGTYEVGSTVASVELNWSYNEGDADPDSQSLNQGIGAIANNLRTTTYSTPISASSVSTTTFTINSSDDIRGSDSDSVNVRFAFRVYYGVTSQGTNLNEAQIEALASNALQSSRSRTVDYDCTGGNYTVYAYPKSYGLATVRDGNGLLVQNWRDSEASVTDPYEVSVTNANGITTDYYVYHSFNLYNGDSVIFQFS
jgi:hypothetical protein